MPKLLSGLWIICYNSTAMKTILIAEDDADIRELIVLRLESGGYTVVAAQDGKQCLEMIPRIQPDILVLDIKMPKIDGYGVLGHISQMRARNEKVFCMPVIVLTASIDSTCAARIAPDIVTARFMKPFKAEELLACIKRALGDA